MTRRFEVISSYRDRGIRIPRRRTRYSAGYDIEAAEDTALAPGAVTLIPTGLKVYMGPGEYLQIQIRSGFSTRHRLSLVNGVGIIDADYVDNPDNEGHILIGVYNHGDRPVVVAKGERIAQGIFLNYLLVDGDVPGGQRAGGFGSTG